MSQPMTGPAHIHSILLAVNVKSPRIVPFFTSWVPVIEDSESMVPIKTDPYHGGDDPHRWRGDRQGNKDGSLRGDRPVKKDPSRVGNPRVTTLRVVAARLGPLIALVAASPSHAWGRCQSP